MHTPNLRCSLATTGPSDARQALRWPGWQPALHAMSLPVWATLLASLLGFGLLVGFQQVVAQSVVQGEQRRTATAAQDRTGWLCQQQHAHASRDRCLALLRQPAESMRFHSVASSVVNPQEK
jgi:hypothetical protein